MYQRCSEVGLARVNVNPKNRELPLKVHTEPREPMVASLPNSEFSDITLVTWKCTIETGKNFKSSFFFFFGAFVKHLSHHGLTLKYCFNYCNLTVPTFHSPPHHTHPYLSPHLQVPKDMFLVLIPLGSFPSLGECPVVIPSPSAGFSI